MSLGVRTHRPHRPRRNTPCRRNTHRPICPRVQVNLDDGMVAVDRFPNGTLQPDPKGFPDGFRVVSDALHAQGFLFGVYTDRGTLTCGGRAAALGNEALDAATYAAWGVDYVKVRALEGCALRGGGATGGGGRMCRR